MNCEWSQVNLSLVQWEYNRVHSGTVLKNQFSQCMFFFIWSLGNTWWLTYVCRRRPPEPGSDPRSAPSWSAGGPGRILARARGLVGRPAWAPASRPRVAGGAGAAAGIWWAGRAGRTTAPSSRPGPSAWSSRTGATARAARLKHQGAWEQITSNTMWHESRFY